MRISIHIETEDAEEAASILASLNGKTPATIVTEEPKREKKKRATKKVEEAEENAEADPMDEAVTLATELINKGNKDDVRALLKEQGVKRVSELKGEALEAFVSAARDV